MILLKVHATDPDTGKCTQSKWVWTYLGHFHLICDWLMASQVDWKTDTTENITFPQFRWLTILTDFIPVCHKKLPVWIEYIDWDLLIVFFKWPRVFHLLLLDEVLGQLCLHILDTIFQIKLMHIFKLKILHVTLHEVSH